MIHTGCYWLAYYLISLANYVYTIYTCISSNIPFSIGGNPWLAYIYALVYVSFCAQISSPENISSKDDIHRYVVMKKTLKYTLVVDIGILFFCAYLTIFKNMDAVVVFLTLLVQSLFVTETLMPLVVSYLDRRAVDTYEFVIFNMLDERWSFFQIFDLTYVIMPLYNMCFSFLVALTASMPASRYGVVRVMLQIFHLIWTHYLFVCLVVLCVSIQTLLNVASPTNVQKYRNFILSWRKLGQKVGLCVYFALLHLIRDAVGLGRKIVFFAYWPESLKKSTEKRLRRAAGGIYMHEEIDLSTVLIASGLFEESPKKAAARLRQLFSTNEQNILGAFQKTSSRKTTEIVSNLIFASIFLPFVLEILCSSLFRNEMHTKVAFLLLWSTYSIPALKYVRSSTIQRTMLLAHIQGLDVNPRWINGFFITEE